MLLLASGLWCAYGLPIAHYPNIAAPTVTITAQFPGADAHTVETAVTAPIERALVGIRGLRYVTSQSSSDGSSSITCTFEHSREIDAAGNDVQSAVNLAQSRLPGVVLQNGITVAKNASSSVMVVVLSSRAAAWSRERLSQYLRDTLVGRLVEIPGVAAADVFGEYRYAVRIWLQPRRLSALQLGPKDVLAALASQNVTVAGGAIGGPPTTGRQQFEYGATLDAALHSVADFEAVVVKRTPDGGTVRLRDVARVVMGSEAYNDTLSFDGEAAVGVAVRQLNDANALEIARATRAVLASYAAQLPAELSLHVTSDHSLFVEASLREVVFALVLATVLVIMVTFAFLGSWRATLVPAVMIPLSFLGTCVLMRWLGVSINTVTLFGFTLATGLVVDDAIVVVEGVARTMADDACGAFAAAQRAMRSLTAPLVASSVCIVAIYVPVVIAPGAVGLLYKQFALTVVCSVSISLLAALTIAPVLVAFLLRAPEERGLRRTHRARDVFASVQRRYGRLLQVTPPFVGVGAVALVTALSATLFLGTRSNFVPPEDQGYIYVIAHGPPYYSTDQTRALQRELSALVRAQPEVSSVLEDEGWGIGLSGNASNLDTLVVQLTPWDRRTAEQSSAAALVRRLNAEFARRFPLRVQAVSPSALPGLGRRGGFQFSLVDRRNDTIHSLEQAAAVVAKAANAPGTGVTGVTPATTLERPAIALTVDRRKAAELDVGVDAIASAASTFLGSAYSTDTELFGHSYHVIVQADAASRSSEEYLSRMLVFAPTANGAGHGAGIPLSALVRRTFAETPQIITHFNGFRSIDLNGENLPGSSLGNAVAVMQQIVGRDARALQLEWTGLAREHVESGRTERVAFVLAIVVIYCVLAALYESLLSPLVVILVVPLAMFGALAALSIRHMALDIFSELGLLTLIGLATKNAVLVMDLAHRRRADGASAAAAIHEAAVIRLRPIVMTSTAFVLGVFPFLIAHGPSSGARTSLGTTVFFGAVTSLVLSCLLFPALYRVIVVKPRVRSALVYDGQLSAETAPAEPAPH